MTRVSEIQELKSRNDQLMQRLHSFEKEKDSLTEKVEWQTREITRITENMTKFENEIH